MAQEEPLDTPRHMSETGKEKICTDWDWIEVGVRWWSATQNSKYKHHQTLQKTPNHI